MRDPHMHSSAIDMLAQRSVEGRAGCLMIGMDFAAHPDQSAAMRVVDGKVVWLDDDARTNPKAAAWWCLRTWLSGGLRRGH